MAVYVDPAIHSWRGKKWCHLTADTEEELHQFAVRIGLKRAWFQAKASMPHYDITENKRAQAIRLGALDIDIHESAHRSQAYRLNKKLQERQLDSLVAWNQSEKVFEVNASSEVHKFEKFIDTRTFVVNICNNAENIVRI